MSAPAADVSTRLCTACGLCCDGTLFQIVRVLPEDSPARLLALGLKLRRKKGAPYFEQPCSALRDRCCTAYADRPTRCRAFTCRQLAQVQAGLLAEGDALSLIHSTHGLAQHLRGLLEACGQPDDGSALQDQCERVLALRLDPALEPEAAAARQQVAQGLRELRRVLTESFLPADHPAAGA